MSQSKFQQNDNMVRPEGRRQSHLPDAAGGSQKFLHSRGGKAAIGLKESFQ